MFPRPLARAPLSRKPIAAPSAAATGHEWPPRVTRVSLDTARPIVLPRSCALHGHHRPAWRSLRGGYRRARPTEHEASACSTEPIGHADRYMTELRIDFDQLSPAERRDLANALLRAAWSAVLEETRILLLDLHLSVDDGNREGSA
jgi:hypothetical protein